jgi:rhodanese-related sulfurtransferase
MLKIFFFFTILLGLHAAKPAYRMINLNEVKTHYDAHDALFIDARDAKMYAKGTILRALNIPLKRFKRMKKWFPGRKDAPLLIFCNGVQCGKSTKLAEKFARAGYTDLMVYTAGFPEWHRHRLPIMSAPKPCRCDDAPYTPAGKPIAVAGAPLYLSPEDGSRVDARWIAPLVNAGTLPAGVQLVDVRPADQYAEGHLRGAANIPFDPKRSRIDTTKFPAGKAILFYCNHGTISADAYMSLPETIARSVKVIEADLRCDTQGCRLEP